MRDVALSKSHAQILLVDDNKSGLMARKSILEDLGHEITIASTPLEAIEQFKRLNFDLVVTDFKMPKMNGIELIQEVRQIRAGVPVILISGFSEALGLTEQSTGANIVIQKSAHEVTQLIRAVNRLTAQAKRKPARAQSGSKTTKKRKA